VKGGGVRIAHIFTPGGLYGPFLTRYNPNVLKLDGPKGLVPIQVRDIIETHNSLSQKQIYNGFLI
jgi:hypothetical protein